MCLLIFSLHWVWEYYIKEYTLICENNFRCPAGVGTWASSFVQTPLLFGQVDSPFANYQINHVLTILATILSPIRAREQFLEDVAQSKDMATDALWVIVDSDGEEDDESTGTSLKENDLVALLNQLPLDNMFRNVLLVQQKDYQVLPIILFVFIFWFNMSFFRIFIILL